jgi:2-phospho-L-lactate transferase/gluconeogenesis factor (CofD/UPF0052 family)
LTLPDGSRVHSDRIEGQWGLKTIRHGGPLDRVQVVSPTTGQPAAPEAVPDAVEAIARAEQLLIMPENLLSDLAAYLSSPGVARALVERRRLGKATDLGLPVTTKDGNPSTRQPGFLTPCRLLSRIPHFPERNDTRSPPHSDWVW